MFKELITRLILVTFFFTSVGPLPDASAQTMIDLPAPGVMVNRSDLFEPLQLKGILVNIKNPLRFDFLVDKGGSGLYGQPLKDEITRLAKYFLTCLAIPDDDLWVNLSPYEKDRIVPGNFGITLMGRDLLEQDYLLKQIMASLSYPENDLGKRFWQKVYKKSYELYGTTNIPINTFNKVWILPKSAQVYAMGNSAFVIKSRLDVMLEADYKAFVHHLGNDSLGGQAQGFSQNAGAYSQVFRDVILPQLRQEVNEGKNFAVVRQVYNAMILATWYKHHLKDSLLGRMYVGRNEVRGVEVADKNAKEKIFQQYLRAYKKCVYNYIKEDYDPVTGQTVPRKYASGGMWFAGGLRSVYVEEPSDRGMIVGNDLAMARIDVTATDGNGEIVGFPDLRAEAVGYNPFREIPLKAHNAFSNNQAMAVPRIFRTLSLPLTLAIGGFLITPTMAEAQIDFGQSMKSKAPSAQAKKSSQTKRPVATPAVMPQKAPLVETQTPQAPPIKQQAVVPVKIQPVLQAPPVKGKNFSPTNGKNSSLKILNYVKSTWPWYTGIAILGIGLGGLWVSRMKLRKQKLGTDIAKHQIQSLGPMALVIKSSSLPPGMTPEEKIILPELRIKMETLLTDIASKGDQDNAMSSGSLSGFFNAVYSTANVWVHEFAHVVAAAVLYPMPKYWKKSLSPINLRGHFDFNQWKEFFLSKLSGRAYQGENPYVSFPAQGWRDRVISYSGIAATILVNVVAFAAVGVAALSHLWLMPFLVGIGFYGVPAISAALMGDINGSILNIENGERVYPCGVSMHSRLGTRKMLAAQGDDAPMERIEDMIEEESGRGIHGVGLMNMRLGKNGLAIVRVEKAIEGKRGPGRDSIKMVVKQMKASLPPMVADGSLAEEYTMDTNIGHNKLASSGIVKETTVHPFIGQESKKFLWSIQNGVLAPGQGSPIGLGVEIARPQDLKDEGGQEAENVTAGIVHNGDNDAYQPLPTDRFIDDIDELRALGAQLVHFQGEVPNLDSAAIPLFIQYHLTQGDAEASVSFSHNTVHHNTIEGLKADILTENEETLAAESFNRGIGLFSGILSRPGLNDPDKTLNDLYVSRETAQANPHDAQLQFQYTALDHLKQYLVNEYKRQAAAGRIPQKMARHWQGPDADKVIEKFVELAIYKFFTGDRETATREFMNRSLGTYGLAIKVSSDLNGVTLVSRKLGMVWGYNLEKGYLDASSDPYALLRKYPNGDQLNTLMFLDRQGKGSMANFQILKNTGKLDVKIFSLEQNRYLTKEEIHKREAPLVEGRYYQLPYTYEDENRRILEDMDVIAPAIARLVKSFDDSNGLKPPVGQESNYQSGREVFKNLFALWINKKIDEKMLKGGEYRDIFLKVNRAVRVLAEQCSSPGACSQANRDFLNTEAQATAENSVLMALVTRWLSEESLNLATRRINGEISQLELQALIPQVIQNCADRMVSLLTVPRLDRLYKAWDKERRHPFSGKEKIGMLFAGDEKSDDGPRTAESSWNALFPNLAKRFISSFKILDYKSLPFDITSPAVTILTSMAGGNFNTGEALDIMKNAVGLEHIWGVTGIPFSPMSADLGQDLRPESPFKGHVFYVGGYYRTQTQGAMGDLTMALHNLLPVFVALQFEKLCPGEHPFGLDLNPEQVKYLKLIEGEMMFKDAKRITGRDEEGHRVLTPVYEALVKRGNFLSNRLKETPSVKFLNGFLIYLIFIFGHFIYNALELFHIIPGPITHSWSGFLVANLDYLLAMYIPLGLSLGYRLLTGYNPWVRLGPPANISVIGKGSYPFVQEMFLRVMFSRSFASWSAQVLSKTYERAIAYLGPSLVRGSWIFGHIPPTPTAQRKAKGALRQLKVTRTGLFGTRIKRTGAISFTTSRGPFIDTSKGVSDFNIDIGGTEFLPPKNDRILTRVFDCFDAWGADLAFDMETSVMGDRLTFGGRLWDPTSKVNRAASLTTESAQPPPKEMPDNYSKSALDLMSEDSHQSVKVREAGSDSAMSVTERLHTVSRPGGIDMSSRLMRLNVTGEVHNGIGVDDNAMLGTVIEGVVPKVSEIVTVTPEMLKAMLGEGYLN